jgi:P4 family phage/plasmid primase-like protien
MDFIEKTLGDYYTIVPISLLTNKRVASNSAQSELVRTKGKRFAVMQEPSEGDKINIGLMKELTGNDTITARALYKENVDFKPQFKMFMTCNDLPDVPSNDGGTWRRIRVLQFKSKFCDVPNEQVSTEFKIDPELSEKIQRWGSTFIGMLINIHNSLDVQKIVEPDEVKVATTSYQRNNDMVGQFVDEVFVKSDNDKLSITKIWALYKAWAKENMNSRKTLEKPHLKQELEKLLGKQVKGSWKGYTIRKIKTSESSSDSE